MAPIRTRKIWVFSAMVAALVGALVPQTASANGRFPRAQMLKAHGDDLVFVATFGMMVSADRGKSWYFVCERSMIGSPTAALEIVDLFLERGSDGAIISGSYRGLRVSRDMGCTMQTDPTLPVGASYHDGKQPNPYGYVIDVAPEKAKSLQAFIAVTGISDKDGKTLNYQIYESLDDARSFKPLGPSIPTDQVLNIFTIDASLHDPKVLFMTVLPTGEAREHQFWISRDGGMSWPERHDIAGSRKGPDQSDGAGSYIAGLHPTDPNKIFMRGQYWIPRDNGKISSDAILVSDDQGKSFREVLRRTAPALGFALSPDGKTVLASFGYTGVVGEISDELDYGIYKADTQALSFERITDYSGSCLTWTADGLYACSSTVRSLYMIGYSKDANFTLSTPEAFQPLLVRREAQGPLPWKGERGDHCTEEWLPTPITPGICDLFQRCPTQPSDPLTGSGPPSCPARGGSDAGGGAGSAGAPGSARAGVSNSGNSSNCGCRVPRFADNRVLLSCLGVALVPLLWRRRKSRN